MMQTPILLNSRAHSKNVLYPRYVPYAITCETATDNCKYSGANVMSELKTRSEGGMITPRVTCREGSLRVNWKHWFG